MSVRIHTSRGKLWLDQIVDKINQYIEEGINQGFSKKEVRTTDLRNIARKYVPTFSNLEYYKTRDAKWVLPLCLSNIREKLEKTGIEIVGERLGEEPNINDKRAREILKKEFNWATNVPVEGISTKKNSQLRWKFDALKDKVAVETELSNRVNIFKDAFKFLVGQAMGQVDVGVILVRRYREGKKPYLDICDFYGDAICPLLPMLEMVFYGFPNKTSESALIRECKSLS